VSIREIDEDESFALFPSTPDFLPAEPQKGRAHIFLTFRGMIREISDRLFYCLFQDLSRQCFVSEHRRRDTLYVRPMSLNGSPYGRRDQRRT
jgi:hypothetical protein